jgi:hypothetical protein
VLVARAKAARPEYRPPGRFLRPHLFKLFKILSTNDGKTIHRFADAVVQ